MHEFVTEMLGDHIPRSLHKIASASIEIVLIFILGLILTWVIRFVFHRAVLVVHKVDDALESVTPEDARRVATLLGVVQTLAILVLWGLMGAMMLGQAGVNIGPILAGAGIMGIALGFGGQYLVRDLITGFFIILENHIRLGDFVRINGTDGLVERITYRVIVLRDLEGVLHVFPHGQVNTLANMTMNWSSALLDIGVAYKEDPDRVMAVLRREAATMAADPAWSQCGMAPAEVWGIENFGPSEVVIRMRIKTLPMKQWDVKREFLRRIKLAFDREGIEIPFPHRSFYLGSQQGPLPVRLEWPTNAPGAVLPGGAAPAAGP
jgi:small conductance mechanosensitive channel